MLFFIYFIVLSNNHQLKIVLMISIGFYLFMLLRATVPRYRIDTLVILNWKHLIVVFITLMYVYFLFFF